MQQINGSVINSMIVGQNYFCCLCFKTVVDSAVHTEDKVFVKKNNNTYDEVFMTDILTSILGSEINDQLSIFNAVCNKCSSEAINSYKFYTQCKDNTEKLGHIIDGLTNGTQICANNTKGFKAGVVSINTENFQFRGYNSCTTASTSLLAYRKYRKLIDAPKPARKKKIPINTEKCILRVTLVRLNPKIINKHSTVFACPSCDKFFARRHSMHLHYRKKHMPDGDKDPFVKSRQVIETSEHVNLASSADHLLNTNDNHFIVVKVEPGEISEEITTYIEVQ